jgi:long-chain acyl-CoA synthetase
MNASLICSSTISSIAGQTRLPRLASAAGDRVATILPNSLELLATYWACAKLGAATVPLSPLLLAVGFLSLLNDAKPRVILSTKTLCGILDEVRPQLA